jgi:hypothetical protein
MEVAGGFSNHLQVVK